MFNSEQFSLPTDRGSGRINGEGLVLYCENPLVGYQDKIGGLGQGHPAGFCGEQIEKNEAVILEEIEFLTEKIELT